VEAIEQPAQGLDGLRIGQPFLQALLGSERSLALDADRHACLRRIAAMIAASYVFMARARQAPAVAIAGLALPEARAAARDHLGVKAGARLGGAPKRPVVDVDDAEALRIAMAPLEVVEQRPGEVAAHGGALFDRAADGAEVLAQVSDAQGIVDAPAVALRRVVERGAVLGDVERQVARPLADPQQGVGERLG